MPHLRERPFQRILLIKPSSLGDIVHALPVLHGLRERFPAARLSWLAASPFIGLLSGVPGLDEVIPFNRRRFGRLGRSLTVSVEFLRFLRDLRGRRFDLVIDLQGLFRSGFLAWGSGAEVRIGFGKSRELAWLFYTHRLAVDDMDTHAVDRNWFVARQLGFEGLPQCFDLGLKGWEMAETRAILQSLGLAYPQHYAVLVPGARWETKRWPERRFARLIDALAGDLDLATVLVGAQDEVALCERVASLCSSRPVVSAGRTTLRQMAAVLAGAEIVVSNDTAPLHLAVALGRPVVAIFGPTNASRTGPYRRPDAVAAAHVPCAPCYLRRLSSCPYEHRCMLDLSADDVMSQVRQTLGGRAAEASPALAGPRVPS